MGKSTILKEVDESLGTIIIDVADLPTTTAKAANPALIVFKGGSVCIDEYQKVPAFLDVIKAELNKGATPGRFVWNQTPGRWWASFVVRVEVPDALTSTGRASGLDVGLTTFATTKDDETTIANHRYARMVKKDLTCSQRTMSAKQKGSKHRAKAKRRHARLPAHVANQRLDFAHQSARELVDVYDVIGVEDLKIKNMSRESEGRKKTGLNRAINDAGWGQFVRTFQWQAKKSGKEIVVLNAYGTTQTSSCCRAKAKPRIELSDRVFRCHELGLVVDRTATWHGICIRFARG
jgi:IS605 OrfB family transposase